MDKMLSMHKININSTVNHRDNETQVEKPDAKIINDFRSNCISETFSSTSESNSISSSSTSEIKTDRTLDNPKSESELVPVEIPTVKESKRNTASKSKSHENIFTYVY